MNAIRVDASVLDRFTTSPIKLIGKVVHHDSRTAQVESNGKVTVNLASERDEDLQNGYFYEFVGKVKDDGSVQEFSRTSMGNALDERALKVLVQQVHAHSELFY
ncbi:hypothetical protein LJB42_003991 [Komagataella kurtzmanii]|nr:hypothetical protein LJB42_003991 [Komagataella kurtzmanii]